MGFRRVISGVLGLMGVLYAAGIGRVYGQDMQSNPLSRMGYGTLAHPTTVAWKGMGGIGIGLNDGKVINLKNPAAYAGTDSLSFLLDVGISANLGHFREGGAGRTTFLGGLEHIALQVPLYKNLIGFSAGIKPFSSAGYGLVSSTSVAGAEKTFLLQTFRGRGTIQQAYAGLAGRFWDCLYVGANVNYFLGQIRHTVSTLPSQTVMGQSIVNHSFYLSDISVDLGLQYKHKLPNKWGDYLILGATYSPATPLKPTFKYIETSFVNDPLRQKTTEKSETLHTTLPQSIGVGLSWNRPEHYVLGVDLEYSGWSKVPNIFSGDGVLLRDTYRAAVGFEFLPNVYSRRYAEVMKYRFGLSYGTSYLETQKVGRTKTAGASFGLGMPVNFFGTERPSTLNLALSYNRTFSAGQVSVDVLQLSFSLSFNETWFRELKIY